MRRILSFGIGAAIAAIALPQAAVRADTLRQALAKAYANNPTLTGARAGLRATDENVAIARAGGRPGIAATGTFDNNLVGTGNSLNNPDRRLLSGVNLSVPLFQGGLVRNSVRGAEARVEAGRAQLRGTEADLFTLVVAAFMDVIRDQSVVQLNQQNVRVLEVNLQSTRDRFEVGDLTITDVAQSEARLAIARAQLQAAEAGLIASRENYIRLVGEAPANLEAPPPLPDLPASADAAVQVAIVENPTLEAAQRARAASAFDVRAARAGRLPRVAAVVGGNYNDFLGSFGAGQPGTFDQSSLAASGGLSLSLPIFQGGAPGARIRQARALESQALERLTEAERGIVAAARSNFSNWRSAEAVIQSSEVAVAANRLSLEGVRAENSVGNRTIIEILNAEQELLNSQVQLVTARRDAYVAGFALLAAMGRAEAADLGLEGGPLYDPSVNYARSRRVLSDWADGDPTVAVSGSTVRTPAQDATVGPITDPDLNRPVDRTPLDPSSQGPR